MPYYSKFLKLWNRLDSTATLDESGDIVIETRNTEKISRAQGGHIMSSSRENVLSFNISSEWNRKVLLHLTIYFTHENAVTIIADLVPT